MLHPAQLGREIIADAAFAVRSFRRSLAWTCVTLLTIALAVGASTAVFSVADTLLLRPLAYRDATRVYTAVLEGKLPGETIALPMSSETVREWRRRARTIEGAAPYSNGPSAFLHGDVDDISVATVVVDDQFLPFTGSRPLIGRNFTAEEMAPNGPRAILLGEGFWRRQYGASPEVLGKVVQLELGGHPGARASTIVGVVPASVALPDLNVGRPDVWLPLVTGERGISGVAVRLAPGMTASIANGELRAILDRVGGIDPADAPLHPHLRLSRPQDALPFRRALALLTGAVTLLLLIAGSNVSHLLLQRGLARERELAVRHAIGAHRARLIRQLGTESTLLGLAGGALAVLVGWVTLQLLARLRPASLPALSYVSTTHGLIPLAAALAIAGGLIIGVGGALHVAHENLGQALRTGATSATRTHRRLRGTLVIAQIALSTTLLAGAILLIRAVIDFERVRLGFDPRHLYAVSFRDRDLSELGSPEARAASALTIRELARRQLGTTNLTIAATATTGMAFPSAFESRDHPGSVGAPGITGVDYVAPDYFSAMRMALVAGRTFDEGSSARGEVIVSQSLARQLGEGSTILGRQYRFRARRNASIEPWQTVVGIAPDILDNRLDLEPKPMLYQPFPGNAVNTTLIVRLSRNDAGDVLRRFARSVQPDPLTWRVTNVAEQIEQSMAEPRFTMSVLVLFATAGVVLAAIGLFGVLSYTLGLRTREIGVRLTLGATRRSIAALFVRDAVGQTALGMALGLAGVMGLTRLIGTSVYGVHGFDTITFVLASASTLFASAMASAAPLFRATRIDPVVAMRAE